jgi:hypothetical protein
MVRFNCQNGRASPRIKPTPRPVVLKQFRVVAPISLDILIVLRELERVQAWPHATA